MDPASDLEPTDRRRSLTSPAEPFGGPADVVMPLSLPPVGGDIVDSIVDSRRRAMRPRRSRTTPAYSAVLGAAADRTAYGAAVDTSHRRVRSAPGSAVRHNAVEGHR
ncbi:hypothetical protein [Nocardia wallacei]|uniref:hypothetical protein n=1 Tax=Nocardia wallacei TaxID=480035 RepID=UPI002458E241|nr:hypothetical protein [Nocardia wallacei]